VLLYCCIASMSMCENVFCSVVTVRDDSRCATFCGLLLIEVCDVNVMWHDSLMYTWHCAFTCVCLCACVCVCD